MAECSICGDGNKKMYCGACTSHLTMRARINVTKVELQLASLRRNVREATSLSPPRSSATQAGNEARTGLLGSRITCLEQRIERINQATLTCGEETHRLKQQTAALGQDTASARTAAVQRERMAANAKANYDKVVDKAVSALESRYLDSMHVSMGQQLRTIKDFLEIFSLKKKRRRAPAGGYEIVLGYNVVPELAQLAHYSVPTINAGVERVAYFVVLLGSYLGIRLPCDIDLPQKDCPYLRICDQQFYLTHSVKTMMRSTPGEFHSACRVLAMLALNVAYMGAKLGVPSLSSSPPAVARLGQLIAQIYLRLESLAKTGHQIQIQAGSVGTDVDTLQDQLITLIDIDIHGRAAEWNIVEAPSP